MDSINQFFAKLAGHLPFGADAMARNLTVGSATVNTFFLVVLAVLFVFIALIVILIMADKAGKAKREAKSKREAAARNVKKAEATAADKGEEGTKGNAATAEQPCEEVAQEGTEDSEQAETQAQSEDAFQETERDQPTEEFARENEQTEAETQEEESTEGQAQQADSEGSASESATEDTTQPEQQEDAVPAAESKTATQEAVREETAAENAEAEDLDDLDDPDDLDIGEPSAEDAVTQTDEESPAAQNAEAMPVTAETQAEDAVPAAQDAEETTAPAQPEIAAAPIAATKASSKKKKNTEDTQMKEEEVKEEVKAKKGPFGTFEVFLCIDGYRFYLYANNKQLLYESVGFTSIEGAMKGIETFRKTLQEYPCIITRDKFGNFRYVFNKRYQGENYTTARSAQSAADSVKRWAENAKVIVHNPKPEEVEAYKKGMEELRTKDDVDWDAVAKAEAEERKMGKFIVDEEGNQDEFIGYRFYLLANNSQILYTSAIYSSAAGALKAIDTFKRAVYIGNFYVDEDKSGRFRYILRSTPTTTYVGEAYATRARAESSIESVKKFVKSATIVPFKKNADEE